MLKYIGLIAIALTLSIAFANSRSVAANQNRAEASNSVSKNSNDNVKLIERYYEAYGRGDTEYMRENVFAPDIKWTIPGRHPLAKVYNGVDEVVGFFEKLKEGNFKAQTLFLEANDEYVVDMHRGWGNAKGQKIDILWCLVYRIKGGKIVEARNFPGDQHKADKFFNAVYR